MSVPKETNLRNPVSIFAPASIGNVSVGFDILGLSLKTDERSLGDVVTVEYAPKNEFMLTGEYADVLPKDHDINLVLKAKQYFFDAYPKGKSDKLKLTLKKDLPICSGLGSSAASVVAAIHALNEFYAQPLSQQECLKLMGQCEAGASGSLHYDNIAPSFLGGLTLCSNDVKLVHHLPWPSEWKIMLAYADIDIPTCDARDALPQQYDKQTLISHSQNVAQFVHALHTMNLELAAHSLTDLVAEPYRQSLLPNFIDCKQALINDYGVKAVGISGSGPTIFALIDGETDTESVRQFLKKEYVDKAAGKRGFVVLAELNNLGVESV